MKKNLIVLWIAAMGLVVGCKNEPVCNDQAPFSCEETEHLLRSVPYANGTYDMHAINFLPLDVPEGAYLLVKRDLAGNAIWSKRISEEALTLTTMTVTAAGECLVGGYKSEGADYYGLVAIAVDEEGAEILNWKAQLLPDESVSFVRAHTLDSIFVLSKEGVDGDPNLYRFDRVGNQTYFQARPIPQGAYSSTLIGGEFVYFCAGPVARAALEIQGDKFWVFNPWQAATFRTFGGFYDSENLNWDTGMGIAETVIKGAIPGEFYAALSLQQNNGDSVGYAISKRGANDSVLWSTVLKVEREPQIIVSEYQLQIFEKSNGNVFLLSNKMYGEVDANGNLLYAEPCSREFRFFLDRYYASFSESPEGATRIMVPHIERYITVGATGEDGAMWIDINSTGEVNGPYIPGRNF